MTGARARCLITALFLLAAYFPVGLSTPLQALPDVTILSSGTLSYEWETGTVEVQDGVHATYQDYDLRAQTLLWNRNEGRIRIADNVRLRHQPQEPEEIDPQAERMPVYQAWLPTSFENRSFLIFSDEVIIFSNEEIMEVNGNSSILFNEGRLNADYLILNSPNQWLQARNIQGGNGTFFFSANAVEAHPEKAALENITLYGGEPEFWSPRIRASRAIVDHMGHASLWGTTIGVGPIPLLYLPRAWLRNWNFGVNFDFGGGFSDKLGTYVDAEAAFNINPAVRLRPGFSYYSKRGVLLSPNFSWQETFESADWETEGQFQSGYINDRGSESVRGVDAFGNPISHHRGYIHLEAMAYRPGGSSFVNQYEFQTDTDVLRDFRPRLEDQYFAPESFSEWYVPFGPFGFTALGRFKTMDVRESLTAEPSVHLDLYPIPVGTTNVLQRGGVGYNRLRLSGGNIDNPTFTEQLEAVYRLDRAYALNDWLTLTPTVGTRLRSYQNSDPGPSSATRLLYETGFDLYGDFHGHWSMDHPIWKIDDLVHRLRPLVGYRWMPVTGASYDELPEIEPLAYLSGTDPLGFSGLENETTAGPLQILRIGVENQLLTRRKEEGNGYRELASWGIYQDFIERRSEDPARPNNLSTRLRTDPAPWFDLQLFARVYSDSFTLQEITPSFGFRNGDQWESRVYVQSLQRTVNQVLWEGNISLSSRNRFLYRIRYDGEKQQLTEQRYGVQRRLGNSWIVTGSTTLRRGDTRQGDFEFRLSFTSLLF